MVLTVVNGTQEIAGAEPLSGTASPLHEDVTMVVSDEEVKVVMLSLNVVETASDVAVENSVVVAVVTHDIMNDEDLVSSFEEWPGLKERRRPAEKSLALEIPLYKKKNFTVKKGAKLLRYKTKSAEEPNKVCF